MYSNCNTIHIFSKNEQLCKAKNELLINIIHLSIRARLAHFMFNIKDLIVLACINATTVYSLSPGKTITYFVTCADKPECRSRQRQVAAHSLPTNLTCAVSGWPRPMSFTWLFNSSRGLQTLNSSQVHRNFRY